MKLRALLGLFAVTLVAMAIAMPIQADTSEEAPPKRVWICHFPGHTMPDSADPVNGVRTDYILNPGGPNAGRIERCESRGGHLIELSEKGAVKWHKAAFQNRIDLY